MKSAFGRGSWIAVAAARDGEELSTRHVAAHTRTAMSGFPLWLDDRPLNKVADHPPCPAPTRISLPTRIAARHRASPPNGYAPQNHLGA